MIDHRANRHNTKPDNRHEPEEHENNRHLHYGVKHPLNHAAQQGLEPQPPESDSGILPIRRPGNTTKPPISRLWLFDKTKLGVISARTWT